MSRKTEDHLKSIITTHPDFHSLPKGVKMMLLVSESLYFEEVNKQLNEPREARQQVTAGSPKRRQHRILARLRQTFSSMTNLQQLNL